MGKRATIVCKAWKMSELPLGHRILRSYDRVQGMTNRGTRSMYREWEMGDVGSWIEHGEKKWWLRT